MFKIGDRVVVVGDCRTLRGGINLKGKVGTICKIDGISIGVDFGKNMGGHDCDDKCTYGNGWFILSTKLKLSETKKSIHIYADGMTTKAVIKDNNKVVKSATAKCSPSDTYNFETGARIAFDRLCNGLAESCKFPKIKEVKRNAKVGEYVKIVKSDENRFNDYKNGDVLLVVEADRVNGGPGGMRAFYKNERFKFAALHEYVVLENYKPTEKAEFKAHLLCTKCDKVIGNIGEEKPYNDKFGNKINIGDVGFIVSKNTIGVIAKDICCKGSYEHFGDIIIVKKYNEIRHGEIINDVQYIKEEN